MQSENSKIQRKAQPKTNHQSTIYHQLVKALETTKNLDLRGGINFYEEIRQYETALIQRSLQLTCGSQKKAARLLGLLPTTLNEKIKRYQISYEEC